MIFKLTSKGFKATKKTYQLVQKHLEKITHRLPHIKSELPGVSLILKKHPSKYLAKRHHHHAYTNFTNRKSSLALFEGSFNLKLPVKNLNVHFKGQTIQECLHTGINRIQKELKKYKDKHFKSQSKYPNRDSIRKGISYG